MKLEQISLYLRFRKGLIIQNRFFLRLQEKSSLGWNFIEQQLIEDE